MIFGAATPPGALVWREHIFPQKNTKKARGDEKMADDGYDAGDYGGGGDEDYDEEEEVEEEAEDEEERVADGFEVRDAYTAADAKAIPVAQHTTTKYMSKYEKARVLGTRALQIR